MGNKVRFKHNLAGYRELMKQPETVKVVDEYVQQVAERAGAGFEGDTITGKNRAQGMVRPVDDSAWRATYKDNALLKALGGGT